MTKRPRRANRQLSLERSVKAAKAIYWTKSRLRKLLPGVFSPGREAHFARALMALSEWPDLSREQVLEDASRIEPRRLAGGRWSWASIEAALREYADRALNGIVADKLRETLAGLDERTRERFMELVVESLPEEGTGNLSVTELI